ncbi:hypothetical protein [Burkholderia ubonensis]|uniref:hypothetical protein n=1 Tax=Burkholderia ubonensis TaxID=101571 RepID=UPI000AFB0EDB|nr:hypothetical protein [Burkholderia ubonensis]
MVVLVAMADGARHQYDHADLDMAILLAAILTPGRVANDADALRSPAGRAGSMHCKKVLT